MGKLIRTAVFAALVTSSALASAQAVGINAAIRNTVTMKTRSDTAPRPAVLKERVSLGDQIRTANASVLQVVLLDRTNFTVGANARVTIDRFVYDPSRSASAVGASVARGAFRFISAKSLHNMPGQTAVRTPVASIGVRGTIFEGVVGPDAVRIALGEAGAGGKSGDNDSATLVVLRGPGEGVPGETPGAIDVTADGQTIAVEHPGLALYIPGPHQPPIGPFKLSDKGLLALDDLLRTTPDTKPGGNGIDPQGNPITDTTLETAPPPNRGN
ncbi:MAG: FecR domain-containing protein [Sphingomicrobium sp.]